MRDNPTVEFGGGGLGDLVLRLYRRNACEILDDADSPHNLIMMCNNPYALELFKWHPNRKNFIFFDLHHKWLEFQGPGDSPEDVIKRVYQFLDLPIELRVGMGPATKKPSFHSVDEIVDENYLVFQPFAGGKNRCLPDDLIVRLLELFGRIEQRVYVVTRSYIRLGGRQADQVVHWSESFPFALPENVIHYSDLSVPATLQLIAGSAGFIGSHSSLVLTAWLEGVPTAVFYQKGNSDFQVPGKGYSFGATRSDCYHASFEEAEMERVLSIVGA